MISSLKFLCVVFFPTFSDQVLVSLTSILMIDRIKCSSMQRRTKGKKSPLRAVFESDDFILWSRLLLEQVIVFLLKKLTTRSNSGLSLWVLFAENPTATEVHLRTQINSQIFMLADVAQMQVPELNFQRKFDNSLWKTWHFKINLFQLYLHLLARWD